MLVIQRRHKKKNQHHDFTWAENLDEVREEMKEYEWRIIQRITIVEEKLID